MATNAVNPPPPLPSDPQDFDSDDRISFSRTDNKYIAVIGTFPDTSEFEWNDTFRRWMPFVDEEILAQQVAQQQSAYGGPASATEDGTNANRPSKKRKRAPPPPRQNTAIYVTGLPLDVTVDEVAEAFSRKCGVIAEEIDSGRPRIKLYTDDKGNLQGDALIVFFKPQSVEMAIMLLDDTDFRYTASGLSSGKMRVQAAEAKYKKVQYDTENADKPGENGGNDEAAAEEGEPVPHHLRGAAKQPRDKVKEQDKQKIIKRTQKLDARLADWDDDDDGPFSAQLETNMRKERVVILRHMFTLTELNEDPAAFLEIKEDIRDECEKLGEVTNVVLYDMEEEGIASVKFKTADAAEACVNLMDGRAFDGRTVRAVIASGKEKFKRSDRPGQEKYED
ncbi:hypothetical protein GGR57DRAFT_450631 [Xylariaceae sp. FL1272]|nr:hypothetical protein GGR57DRAFT_450631 [Xylariaceae sp. FL1272]